MMLEPSRLQAYVRRRPSSVFSPRSAQFDSKHTNFGSFTLPTNLALLTAPKSSGDRPPCDVTQGSARGLLESCELTLLGTIRFLLPLITLSILTRSEPPVHTAVAAAAASDATNPRRHGAN